MWSAGLCGEDWGRVCRTGRPKERHEKRARTVRRMGARNQVKLPFSHLLRAFIYCVSRTVTVNWYRCHGFWYPHVSGRILRLALETEGDGSSGVAKVESRDARTLGRKALEVCEQDILAGSRWLWLWEPDIQARAIVAGLPNVDLLTSKEPQLACLQDRRASRLLSGLTFFHFIRGSTKCSFCFT